MVKDNFLAIDYTVNPDACITYITSLGWSNTESEITTYCNGGTMDGTNIEDDVRLDYLTYEELEQAGTITIHSKEVDGVIIREYDKMNSKCSDHVVIPETIGGKVVRKLQDFSFAYNFYRSGSDPFPVKSVVLPSGLEEIGQSAFIGYHSGSIYNKIETIDFSGASSLKVIGPFAFAHNYFTEVEIPASVLKIENQAFGSYSGGYITKVIIHGKSSISDFTSYPDITPFGWASAYSDKDIIWTE